VGQLYKVLNPGTDWYTIPIVGHIISPSDYPVDISNGWNWIGVNTATVISSDEAFANLNPEEGDMVKGLEGFSTYVNNRWRGTLNTLTPGNGYLYLSQATGQKSFCYPSVTIISGSNRAPARPAGSSFAPVDHRKYPNNMTMVAEVHHDGVVLSQGEVAVFVDGECRHASAYADEESLRYLTIPGQGSGALEVYVELDGQLYTTDVIDTYADNKMVGTVASPLIIQLGEPTSIERITTGDTPHDGNIYDLTGRKVDERYLKTRPSKGVFIQNGKKVVR
jgi:hypothetical protein